MNNEKKYDPMAVIQVMLCLWMLGEVGEKPQETVNSNAKSVDDKEVK